MIVRNLLRSIKNNTGLRDLFYCEPYCNFTGLSFQKCLVTTCLRIIRQPNTHELTDGGRR